jgi:hypothetical protein
MEWLDIFTAPQDGSVILVFFEDEVWVAYFTHSFGGRFVAHDRRPGYVILHPTHWMKLPEPPEGEFE